MKRRLTLHFSLQFIAIAFFMGIVLITLIIIILNSYMKKDLNRSFPTGALDLMVIEVMVEDDKAVISEEWNKLLKKKRMWFQVINEKGKVIGESNVPSNIPNVYTAGDLLQIEEKGQLNGFSIYYTVDTDMLTEPYFYMLGFKNESLYLLEKIFEIHNEDGIIQEKDLPAVEKKLKADSLTLHIVDHKGDVIQSFGGNFKKKSYEPLELIRRKESPGYYDTEISTVYDPETKNTWVLHKPSNMKSYTDSKVMKEVLTFLIIIGAAVLLITLAVAFWHGFRYGQPLLIFTSWLGRMEAGQYDEVLTEQEKKKIFKRNGRVKLRYRLYQEVFKAFYEMAEKLSSTEKERNKLEKTREEWMTGISHDLRTPLSTVQGYGHLLESGKYDWSEDELKDMGKMIREKGDYMLHLVEDFSLAFKLKNNTLIFTKETVQLNEFLQNIVLKFVNDRTIPNASFSFIEEVPNVRIKASLQWFERILDNLIYNAINHNPPGTKIAVSIKESDNPGFALIEVKDDGVGMDEETKENLFERYYRGTNTEERTEGAGLGMSIAKAIVQLHDGEISVVSAPNKGTAVTLKFPIERG
ncbi:HAMP domain-containing sensor histidine kinase [Metabacillus fastidiosus]|uniref:HAMP domain-containing sensor histidine kinase n=1 Tax=Metabacillus fastidiosus TaxID=1458 RepID=UPI002DBF3D57|nr:HAMP domain-containing sensor histidine kinase [Metabacillus fastidiosus]MEC2075015.1 HAMP domain-containing sensor histidine kinase [Metabacillus fastidiosus]